MAFKPYKVSFTQAAKVEAVKRGLTLEQIEAYIRDDIRKCVEKDCYPPNLFFHTVDHDQPKPWLVVGEGGDIVTVDSCTYTDGEPLEEGPFKGKRVGLPQPDSADLWAEEPE